MRSDVSAVPVTLDPFDAALYRAQYDEPARYTFYAGGATAGASGS
ncbi:MAG: hypothetical protein ACJAU5_001619 [Maricaulis maris]|jgi:hypothetical protein